MRIVSPCLLALLFSGLALLGFSSPAYSQFHAPAPILAVNANLSDAPESQASGSSTERQNQPGGAAPRQDTQGREQTPVTPVGTSAHTPVAPPQPKRILGLMPNYRAVSAGELPPPPTPKESFKIATQNSFDYSSFVFVGLTSLIAEGTDAHPQLGKGVPGYWGYSWRGFVDKTDGDYWVEFVLPTMLHQDERYYAKGKGPLLSRIGYAASRVLITPNYHGKNTFNTSEVIGRGISQSIALTYYPSKDQAVGPFIQKYAFALARDALTNVFREVFPDINQHLHRHRQL